MGAYLPFPKSLPDFQRCNARTPIRFRPNAANTGLCVSTTVG